MTQNFVPKEIFNISVENVSQLIELENGKVVVVTKNGVKIIAYKKQFSNYNLYVETLKKNKNV